MEKPRTKETQKGLRGRTISKQLLQWHPSEEENLWLRNLTDHLEGEAQAERLVNLWLRNLTDHLEGEAQAERLVRAYQKHKDNTL